jgi:trans-2,3-dihydro-3-hydroxyanthranilate isomerase
LGSGEAVSAASPDVAALTGAGAGMTYLVGREDDALRVRFFAPEAGVSEDPATGSAASAFAAVRVFEGETAGTVVIHQGAEIGHPSTIHLKWDSSRASLGGTVRRDEVRILEG